MAGGDGVEDLAVRKEHALGGARCLVAIQNKHGFFDERNTPRREFANAEFRPLQICENADGVAVAGGAGADRVIKCFGAVVG